MPVDQQVVLVTGASSGIGAACAEHLARHGYRVYGASRSAVAAAEAGVLPLRVDVADDESVASGFASVMAREGRLDALVNSAGMGLAGAIELTSPSEARAQFEANFFGVLRTCRAAIPRMRTQRTGAIVNIGSIAGQLAVPYQGLYSASKFALEGFTEALRLEVKRFGIRVVLVEPGDHRTGFTAHRVMTAESAGDTPYREASQRAVDRMRRDEQQGPGPERIALLVHRVLCCRNPRLRYTTGPVSQRAAVWLKRLAPNRLTERVMADYYGV